jgi:hypothetical protein
MAELELGGKSINESRKKRKLFQHETVFEFASHKLHICTRIPGLVAGKEHSENSLNCAGNGDKTGLDVWSDATNQLSQYLTDHAKLLVQNKSVLELGAGAGVCGLLAAMLGAADVELTDMDPDVLQLLQMYVCYLVLCKAVNLLDFNSATRTSTSWMNLFASHH